MRPMRSPRMAAIGASSTGGRSTASPGSASRNPLTQFTSGNRRVTCRNESAMPMRSTPMISALRPGLARNAVQICLLSTTTTSTHRIRNTSIRTRKIRGEESLNGSRSFAMVLGSRVPGRISRVGSGRRFTDCACPSRKTGSRPGSGPGQAFPGHALTRTHNMAQPRRAENARTLGGPEKSLCGTATVRQTSRSAMRRKSSYARQPIARRRGPCCASRAARSGFGGLLEQPQQLACA